MADKNLIDRVFYGILKNTLSGSKEASKDTSDNIFHILQTEDKERFHSRFLCYLIKTRYNSFKKYFIGKGVDFPDGELNLDKCCCEFPCGKMIGCKLDICGYVDIYLPTKSGCAVAIEVKWYAYDQPAQLLRYKNCLKENSTLIYLSLGKEPSEKSTACGESCERCQFNKSLTKDSDYYVIGFADILDWLNTEIKTCKDNGSDFVALGVLIQQYADVLTNEIKGNEEMEIIKNEIKKMIKSESDDVAVCKSVIDIENGIRKLRNVISEQFLEGLEARARDRESKYKEYKVINKDYCEFKKISDGDSYAEFACVDCSENGFAICCETNLYCYKISKGEIDGKKWSYITTEWFDDGSTKKERDQEERKAIRGNVASEHLMKWYFSDNRNAQLEKILDIAKESCKTW